MSLLLQNPEDLMALSGAYWQSCALHAAVKLNLFTILDGQGGSAAEVAGTIDGDARGTGMLLDALCAMGLLEKKAGTYVNRPLAREALCRESPGYIGHLLLHHHHLVESWSRLDEAVLTGQPVRARMNRNNDARRESFLLGMSALAMKLAPDMVPRLDLGGRRRLLDLGGGPGTWSVHFCLHNPGLSATVFDLPGSRPFAERTIAQFGLQERITFVPGDFHNDSFGGPFDVAWLSHILHGEGPAECETIIAKAARTLECGGLLIVHDFLLDERRDAPLFPALFSLNMLLGTQAGQAYSEQEVEQMLHRVGLESIRRVPGPGTSASGIITGIRR